MLPKPLVLAIETSAPQGGVALRAGGQLLDEILISDQKRHTSEIHPALSEVLSRHALRLADIDVFGFSVGPGSFTGLRLGATIARIVAAVTDAVVVAVPSLEVLASNALPGKAGRTIAAVLDARRGGIFAGLFEVGDAELHTLRPAELIEPAEFAAMLSEGFAALGNGLAGLWRVVCRPCGRGRRELAARMRLAAETQRLCTAG
jgi:tRNA threonylcarbamoyladenosine biosynthesis protein TsaB